ncbi:substrate-binding domain-containing protein [Mahella australiensis]|uniref:Monosaccharide ABC transporter substrate-binding protein, CUT2 family n=1 Tax=Mahella australiensis (strain DSM 15567 / CIP 107919 / 50-1 BON) TaxID=697281 RepID=F3ZWC8_MAHA5|nr:substrate-binding domain-containing protein [Mahella australiensis]AEE97537.1 monosaccharide ABC transporter substrate-binding protein, CUT2 family [Mahella australiensis 50-1 BON]
MRFVNYIKNNIINIILIIAIMITGAMITNVNKKIGSFVEDRPKYHFYMVAPNLSDPFWQEVKKGADDAAKHYSVAYEFKAPRFNDSGEEKKFLNIAIASEVDGIVTHVPYNEDFTDVINAAADDGIPVVTMENDAAASKRKTFVGVSNFLLGEEAAKLVNETMGGKGRVAVIINSAQRDISSQNITVSGFKNAIAKNYNGINIADIYTSEMGILSAEDIVGRIIRSQPKVDAIYVTDASDTLGVAQAVVDYNKVGEIKIVGYGDSEDILDYINKGVIYGVVMNDPYKMGYNSIKSLVEIKKENNVSAFIDTDLKIITKDDIIYAR